MKEFSKEKIEIDGTEYTLFLNRKGIVAYEKFCKDETDKVKELSDKYSALTSQDITDIKDDTNPFEGLDVLDDINEDEKTVDVLYQRLYWILLYTEHKLSQSEAAELYNKACNEYGKTQIIALANQMFEDANKDQLEQKNLKNLAALRPTK